MRHRVVEGEPGIFPDPIARMLRGVGRLLTGRRQRTAAPAEEKGRPHAEVGAMSCTTCRAIAGEVVLTSGPRLELDEYWRVEHCHPVAAEGWLVLVLRRHARALHELTEAEWTALGRWLSALTKALHEVTGSELEYVMQFAEGEGFHHVHVHLVARSPEWPAEWRGPRVFAAFGVDDPVGADRVTALMEAIGAQLGIPTTPLPT